MGNPMIGEIEPNEMGGTMGVILSELEQGFDFLIDDAYLGSDYNLEITEVKQTIEVNLSNAAAVGVYEVLRQHDFPDQKYVGSMSENNG